jgi:hypothetical protein
MPRVPTCFGSEENQRIALQFRPALDLMRSIARTISILSSQAILSRHSCRQS